jgi:tetratricopeptide (TPR) repeat protein
LGVRSRSAPESARHRTFRDVSRIALRIVGSVGVLTVLTAASASRQQRCDRAIAGPATDAGWAAYRANDLNRADSSFRAARRACGTDAGAMTGLGYVALRQNALPLAIARFDTALALSPTQYDALSGRGMAAWRAGRLTVARESFTRALAAQPGDSLSLDYLRRISGPAIDTTPIAPRLRPAALDLLVRTGDRRFEVRDASGSWRPFWIKAVNIGAALPGKHPSEFPPDDSTYDRWIDLVGRMGGNSVRVYTIHPPHFYRALDRYNRANPSRPIRLLHGVWTELPPGAQEERYDDPAWKARFFTEMRRVVDLLHGQAIIRPSPGHASGRYDVDVSRWVLGFITGREWEPYSVVAYTRANPGLRDFAGRYVQVRRGNAMDVWLARFSDSLVSYGVTRYNTQFPVAYTNWPTLDPLTHPTEATRAEQEAIMKRRGEVPAERSKEYDNDAIALDAVKATATAAYPAGVFASYHAYPYYPDFMVVDPGYRAARSPEGPSAYFGYLKELVDHHGSMPVVISEYGVPSSRGNAHVQPQGWDHGGHSEADQAAINARLTREIHASGAAGAGLFAIIDEWFKKNWLVIDFEKPAERNRLWLNVLDAEQNYGIVAMRAGDSATAMKLDGRRDDWRGTQALYARHSEAPRVDAPVRIDSLFVRHDEAYLHLRLDVGRIDWSRGAYLIGIDTYNAALGDSLLPRTGTRVPVGLEFVVDLRGPGDARVLVDRPYGLYRMAPIRGTKPVEYQQVYNAPFRTRANAAGEWDSLYVVTNRRRIGRDGTVYPAIGSDRNRLLFAREDSTTLADWFADASTETIEIRVPWGMLQVLDPSSRTVLFGSPNGKDPGGAVTSGFRFVVKSYDPSNLSLAGDLAPRGASGFAQPPLWTWPTWEVPRWHARLKPLFESMRATFSAIPD